ncbi:hypothetical protein BDY21DRAFT_403734 [Lineolata rhizophorae]|uniref:Uncharacterized protein n=1 Tax=Lineolata rhizophorae TaxID=578093 RepID=A0A6A6NPI3_9PEZI|nr:hypothetical protein BDY21DRAFT_403734 [Lineolata rhizophorae]
MDPDSFKAAQPPKRTWGPSRLGPPVMAATGQAVRAAGRAARPGPSSHSGGADGGRGRRRREVRDVTRRLAQGEGGSGEGRQVGDAWMPRGARARKPTPRKRQSGGRKGQWSAKSREKARAKGDGGACARTGLVSSSPLRGPEGREKGPPRGICTADWSWQPRPAGAGMYHGATRRLLSYYGRPGLAGGNGVAVRTRFVGDSTAKIPALHQAPDGSKAAAQGVRHRLFGRSATRGVVYVIPILVPVHFGDGWWSSIGAGLLRTCPHPSPGGAAAFETRGSDEI